MKLTRTDSKTKKEVWFCGCEIGTNGYGGAGYFTTNHEHKKFFDKKKKQNIYVCHIKHVYRIEEYNEL